MPLRIEDYAFISDLQTGALVGSDGSIDWTCFPRFDSAACFAALVGHESNGRWLISPKGEYRFVGRRYVPGTLILETDLRTDGGELRLIDFMPVRGVAPDIVRIVRCTRGRLDVTMDLCPRFDFGLTVPFEEVRGEDVVFVAGPDCLYLRASLHHRGVKPSARVEWTMKEGDEESFALTWHPSHLERPHALKPRRTLEDAERWWKEWSSRSRYDGPYADAVGRSLAVLKGLTHAPSGGITAALTTSLPERLGGERNWDYRFCWIRDATFTLYALLFAGYVDEARAWRDWLVRAVGGEARQLQVLYGVEGERRIHEEELPWLAGYAGSRPVRSGNAAVRQLQLDVFGEMFDTLHQAHRHGLRPSSAIWSLQRDVIDFVIAHWEEPDRGIWEMRDEARHFTHSKVMAWVAIDRAVQAAEALRMEGPIDSWRGIRERIRGEILRRGFNPRLGSFVQTLDGESLDASLLLLPMVGFLPPSDERVRGTIAAVERELLEDGFVRRYLDADTSGIGAREEGAFLPCSFWLADNYVLQGRIQDAKALFERLLSLRNDVGLLSEAYDVHRRALLGNFPQAITHVSLINTARNLAASHGPVHHRSSFASP